MKRVLVVFGTRPEAIKMAPVIAEMKRRPSAFEPVVAVTAQHRHMLDQVTGLFGIVPDFDLGIMRHGQTLADVTRRALEGLDEVMAETAPDACLVQGDTTTTFTAALAAFYHRVPVGHVEAGLRTDNKLHPYPEEVNRRLTTQLAEWHFAPTAGAAARLAAESVPAGSIFVTGNTVIDALLDVASRPYEFEEGTLREVLSSDRRIVLVTLHRRENWGGPTARVCEAIRELLERREDIQVLFACHANPVVRDVVTERLGTLDRVLLLGPVEYVPFVKLMQAATLILSDSGGIQEEAPSLGTPVLVLRETTERPEAIAAGTARLVGTDTARIVREAERLLEDAEELARMTGAANPFGDGEAARRICDVLEEELDDEA